MKEAGEKSNYFLIVLLALVLSIVFVGCEAEGIPTSIANELKLSKSPCRETKGGKRSNEIHS